MENTTVQGLQAPYVLEITNSAADPITDVKLFDAMVEINNPFFGSGHDYVCGSLKITSPERDGALMDYRNISYRDMLTKFCKEPARIAAIYVQDDAAPEQWAPFALQSSNARELQTVTPKLVEGQKNKHIVSCEVDFMIDQFAKMIISSVPAKSKVTYYFYAMD